jgi:transposase
MSSAAPPLSVTAEQREVLETWSRSRVLPQRQVQRARIILLAAEGRANELIAKEVGCSKPSVLKWRDRFAVAGVDGLEEAGGRGRKPTLGRGFVEKVMATTLGRPPKGTTHWTTRSLADRLGVSHMTVHRVWRDHRLQPHRIESFKFSTDPQLVEKVSDVVGLYLDPPEKAVVLSVDEKSQIQALDRTQPLLPMRPGQPERRTHDFVRHGTTTLFAALDVASGEVTGKCYRQHRHEEFLAFLNLLDRTYPKLELHLILDNYRTHKHPDVVAWLAQHRRFHFHFTPTSASWMNQVEIWFSILSRRAIERGVFRSVAALRDAITRFLDAWNNKKRPFVWVKSAEQILARADRQHFMVTGH